jgi:hypothetical protein
VKHTEHRDVHVQEGGGSTYVSVRNVASVASIKIKRRIKRCRRD